ncbi:MAG TPA: hypothetical protein VGR92_04195 [Steroidobacteraceae bacterium]|nr:hypothetical protein [Steroidobacteraceae bacterium]
MLGDVIALSIADERDMIIVDDASDVSEKLDDSVRQHRVDVVIFAAGAKRLDAASVSRLLLGNPRLGLIEVAPHRDGATLHRLVASHDDVGPLTRTNLTHAIRTAACLRRH